MKSSMLKWAGLGLTLGILACGAGCASYNAEQAQATQVGAQMQKSGIMSQADYVRVRQLGHQAAQTHTLSDGDLTYTLSLLGGANNSVARARALTILSEIRPMSPAQKARIAPVIAPYLNSADPLDKAGAQRVERAMRA